MIDRKGFLFYPPVWIAVAVALSVSCHAGRSRESERSGMAQSNVARSRSGLNELKQQIEAFAEYGGEKGDSARHFLADYPSEQLIADIEALRSESGEDETFKTELAFALCCFGHDYESNRSKIVEALRASRSDIAFDSIGAQSMIAQLIKRGDTELLPELFNAATWSDGALSEGLASTFSHQLLNDPNSFLLGLRGTNLSTRRAVYKVTEGSSLSHDEMIEVKKYLTSGRIPAHLQSIANELVASLR